MMQTSSEAAAILTKPTEYGRVIMSDTAEENRASINRESGAQQVPGVDHADPQFENAQQERESCREKYIPLSEAGHCTLVTDVRPALHLRHADRDLEAQDRRVGEQENLQDVQPGARRPSHEVLEGGGNRAEQHHHPRELHVPALPVLR